MTDESALPVRIEWPDEDLWPQSGYANVFFVNHTAWDFTLRVGHVLIPSLDEAQLKNKKVVKVDVNPVGRFTVPPQAMKQLAEALSDQIRKYEAHYGEIPALPREEESSDAEKH